MRGGFRRRKRIMKRVCSLLLSGSLCLVLHHCDWGLLPVTADGEQDVEDVDHDGLEADVVADRYDDRAEDPWPADGDAPDPDAADPDGPDPDAVDPDTPDPDMADPDLEEPEIPPDCGNGELDDGEECDDGAANSNSEPDACRLDCTRAHCGDGVTDSGEECDDGTGNSDTVPDACRLDCTRARCGDGVTDGGEECDDGAGNSDTAPDACRLDCTRARCGDGVVDSGEDCDYVSDFCSGCTLAAPAGWTACVDSAGNPLFLYIALTPDNVTQAGMGDACVSLIQAMAPRDFQFYGLAVIIDQNVWDCILPMLSTTQYYYVGLDQASSGSEPAGGWRWRAHNGTAWFVVSAYNDANPYFDEVFDNGAGTGEVDCGRLAWDTVSGAWVFYDYGCDSQTNWDGICMIQF
jgi:hypothetical protein